MRSPAKMFKDVAAQTCHDRRFSFSKFMQEYGLEDVLEEAASQGWSAKEVAGQVLFRCCVTDGRFNNFQVGFLSVMVFLNEACGSLGTGWEQAFKDLASILKSSGTPEAIAGWLNTHYQ
jgi:hypothetical protein